MKFLRAFYLDCRKRGGEIHDFVKISADFRVVCSKLHGDRGNTCHVRSAIRDVRFTTPRFFFLQDATATYLREKEDGISKQIALQFECKIKISQYKYN
jgi:hypothetical protein